MNRGIVHDTMTTPTSHIQVCRYDQGDAWSLFVTAHEPVFDGDTPVVYDWPVEGMWPEFTTVEELDLFIEKLQAQREWLVHPTPRGGLMGGREGWVWDPDVPLVTEMDALDPDAASARVFGGYTDAEFVWVIDDQGAQVAIAKFCDWTEDGSAPVFSPQWRANGHGGVDIPGVHADYEPRYGAMLITSDHPQFADAEALLDAAARLGGL